MARQQLKQPLGMLEHQIIETLLADHYQNYPKSYSDMQGCVRNLLRMFEVKRRPVSIELEMEE